MSFQSKIFLMIIVVHVILGAVSIFLVNNIVTEALSIGLNPRIGRDIERIYEVSKEEIATRKRLYDYICRDLYESLKSGGGLKEGGAIKDALMRNISVYTDLQAIRYGGEEIELLPVLRQTDSIQYVSRIEGEKNNFGCVFAVPEVVVKNQKTISEVIRIYENIFDIRKDLSTFYVRIYILLFGISFLFVMLFSFIQLRLFFSSINEIRRGIRRIKNNIMDEPVVVKSKDEMGELALELNRMSSELRLSREREAYLERISSYQEVARRVAHEIKNPLTPIRLTFQEIRARYNGGDPKFMDILKHSEEIIEEEIEALNRIIGQFREFAGMPVAVKELVVADMVIDDILRSNNYFRDRIIVKTELKAKDAEVELDKLMIKKAVENLIQNSIEANAKNVKIISSSDSDRYILRVEDDGEGVDEGIRDVIFEPYFTTKDFGTGLGLSLVKKTVLEHKGSIYLDRNFLCGTAFIIELPVYNRSQ